MVVQKKSESMNFDQYGNTTISCNITKVMGLAGSAGYFDALIIEVSQVMKFSIRIFFLIL